MRRQKTYSKKTNLPYLIAKISKNPEIECICISTTQEKRQISKLLKCEYTSNLQTKKSYLVPWKNRNKTTVYSLSAYSLLFKINLQE